MNSETYNNDDVDYLSGNEGEEEQNSLSENEESDSSSVQDVDALLKVIRPMDNCMCGFLTSFFF